MRETPDAVADGGHDLRVRMPEDCTHLAGREVQHAPPLGVIDESAFGGVRGTEVTWPVRCTPQRQRVTRVRVHTRV